MAVGCSTYRLSHLDQGSDYDRSFSLNPRRSLLWRLERRMLIDIQRRFLYKRAVDHLDFACGTGRVLGFMEPRVSESVGIDVSASMLAVAQARLSRSTLIQSDLTREDVLKGRKFDLITAFRFFPNAEADLRREAMAVLVRHLKPDGILVFNNHRSTQSLRKRTARLLTAGRRGNTGMSSNEATSIVECAGLSLARTYHAGIVPEFERWTLRPRRVIALLEGIGSLLPLNSLAEDVVYVCRHKDLSRRVA